MTFPWPDASATGVGSMPGTDVREAMRVVLGEVPDLPHLPELPARGPGADLVGRGVAALVDLHAEVWPSGWRLAASPGRDERRARDYLDEDLDVLEEQAFGLTSPVKVALVGPWTLAASVELPHGDKALADPGACRDLAQSLAEGLGQHLHDVHRRLPHARVLAQLDEPALPAVLSGTVPTASGFGHLEAVEPEVAEGVLREVLAAASDAFPVVHCCAADAPIDLLRRAGAAALSLDLAAVLQRRPGAEEELGTALEAGVGLFAGVVAPLGPVSEAAATVGPVRELWRRLGLSGEDLARVVVTPTCGLAGSDPGAVPRLLAAARAGARLLRDQGVDG